MLPGAASVLTHKEAAFGAYIDSCLLLTKRREQQKSGNDQ